MSIWINGKILIKHHCLKKTICSNLNMKYNTDVDYIHAKMFCKNFDLKNSGKYQDFYLKSDTLLLVHVFENSRKMCRNL